MKKKLAVCICALALALSMSIPAFAEVQDSTGETSVKFAVSDSQISVTLPLNISVAVTASDGTITWPTATEYQLVNNSAFAVKVSKIACTTQTGWALGPSGSDTISATVSPDAGTTTVTLLTSEQTCSGNAWNMAAGNGTLSLTLAGSIVTPGTKTQELTTTAATAFTIMYTVEAGANA